jgi:CRISPR-associated exonuclease Cas4
MFSESDLLPISGLQHLLFCDRQAALIHLEQAWADNALTVEGSHLHEVVHGGGAESRRDIQITRGIRIRSLSLGLSGQTDVVEFHRLPKGANDGAELERLTGRWRPFPVEYKRGKPKRDHCDEVQLCAQALCLEEMLGTAVPAGALFYGKTRRRKDVALDQGLREVTIDAASRFRTLIEGGRTPHASWAPKCDSCSLLEICLPRAPEKSARRYLAGVLGHIGRSEET